MNPDPKATLVVLFGASSFPKAPQLGGNTAFLNSAVAVKEYFLSPAGFGLPRENLLDLFDAPESFSDLDEKLGIFLSEGIKENIVRDLIIYYVGHGSFAPGGEYFLAIRATRSNNDYHTSYAARALAKTLREHAAALRKYLIFDSCFSAAAYASFQSAPLIAASTQILHEFPARGTALLCASGPREPAKAPLGQKYTMFSGAFIDVLRNGSIDLPSKLTFEAIGELTSAAIKRQYADEAVRPQVHCPDQSVGEIVALPLFPNLAKVTDPVAAVSAEVKKVAESLRYSCELFETRIKRLEDLKSAAATEEDNSDGARLRSRKMTMGLTDDEWSELPASVKIEISRYLKRRKFDFSWSGFAMIVCFMYLGPAIIGRPIPILGSDGVVCVIASWILALYMLCCILCGGILPKHSKSEAEFFLGASYSSGKWDGYDIVIAARDSRATFLAPGVEIGRGAFALSFFLYAITSITSILVKVNFFRL